MQGSNGPEDIIISAALFGSVAKGKEKPDSDIGILVISNDFDAASQIVADALVAEVFHTHLAPITFSQKEL